MIFIFRLHSSPIFTCLSENDATLPLTRSATPKRRKEIDSQAARLRETPSARQPDSATREQPPHIACFSETIQPTQRKCSSPKRSLVEICLFKRAKPESTSFFVAENLYPFFCICLHNIDISLLKYTRCSCCPRLWIPWGGGTSETEAGGSHSQLSW